MTMLPFGSSTEQPAHPSPRRSSLRLVQTIPMAPTQNFDVILVRIELSGHTQVFLEKKPELICPVLNEYFSRAYDLIQRYGGTLHQQMGEEVVFYFRDDSPGTAAMALACVRSIVELAQKIEGGLSIAEEPYFKVRASLVAGPLHQLTLESGNVLTGLPFVESSKLLSHFDEKIKNLVCFYSKSHHGFSFLCDAEVHKLPVLKKFSEPVSVSWTTRFRDQQSFLQRKNFQAMSFFRGDGDLQQLLNYFAANLSFETEEQFAQGLKFVRNLHLKTATPELVEAVHELLKVALQRNREKWVSDRALASTITLLRHLIPPPLVSEELLKTLSQGLDHIDARICANTIAALGDLRENSVYLKNYIRSPNNRVSSEALLAAGKENLTSAIVDKVVENFSSPDPLHQASAVFVSQSLLDHYRSLDQAFYAESPELRRLEEIAQPKATRKAA